ncbi:phosphomannomutase [Musa troglodytarum]|uniref:Phosphomannomutase n=1 Tax=Musa troglodytarum TaxID=320322 RepID=A0A9E7HYD1_9LILI|nr:phosphomannomutase [Musa troglodytarum]
MGIPKNRTALKEFEEFKEEGEAKYVISSCYGISPAFPGRSSPTRPLLLPWPTAVQVALLLSLFFSLRVPRPDLASHLGAKSHDGQRFRARARSLRGMRLLFHPTTLCRDQIGILRDRSFQKSIGRMAARKPGVFDVDGTLTAPRKVITPQMLEFMRQLRESLKSFLGEDKLKEFINFTLHYIAGLDISIKRIAAKKSMMNLKNMIRHVVVLVHNIRPKMISVLREKFAHMDLTFSIGGQISFDGGNDYEIYESERTVGHTVTSPDDTAAQCRSLFLGN